LNKAVSLSFKRHRSDSVTDRFQVCHANREGSPLNLALCMFVNNQLISKSTPYEPPVAFQIKPYTGGTDTINQSSNFPNFCFRG